MKFEIGFMKNGVCQSRIIDGPDAETCSAFFRYEEPAAEYFGIQEADSVKPGQPVDTVPAGWTPESVYLSESYNEAPEAIREAVATPFAVLLPDGDILPAEDCAEVEHLRAGYPGAMAFRVTAQEAQEAQEAPQTGETLYLEKRGCDFFNGDPVAQLSDIGNYRVVTHGETIPGKDGRMYCFEFTHWERYNYRTTHKVTGRPLKHHVKELMNSNALCIDSQYTDHKGCWRNCTLESELHSRNRDFTVAGILETVNEVSSTHYSRIVFAPEKAIKAVSRIRKQAGFRELSILDNLESVEVKQADRQYLVFAYYDMDGNGFEYEYNSDRIVG